MEKREKKSRIYCRFTKNRERTTWAGVNEKLSVAAVAFNRINKLCYRVASLLLVFFISTWAMWVMHNFFPTFTTHILSRAARELCRVENFHLFFFRASWRGHFPGFVRSQHIAHTSSSRPNFIITISPRLFVISAIRLKLSSSEQQPDLMDQLRWKMIG